MPKAKKLPSGSYRIRVFDYSEKILKSDGTTTTKKHYVSFTASSRTEAERLAAEWKYGKRLPKTSITTLQAINGYIDSKAHVLSPSTVTGYRSQAKSAYDSIGHISLAALTSTLVQRWVNECAKSDSPKTVRNKYALLSASYEMYTGQQLSIALPAPKRPDLYTPTSDDVNRLIAHTACRPASHELNLAIMLSAYCGLRLSEICALEASDIVDGRVIISKARVQAPDGFYSTKQPKSYAGYRSVPLPSQILDSLKGKQGRIIHADVKVMSDRFRRAVRYTFHGEKQFRFHDLRHFYASVAHAIGVPDEYIMATGGWKTDHVMKRIYRGTMSDVLEEQAKKIVSHFQDSIV